MNNGKYIVECKEVQVIRKTYRVTASSEEEAKQKVIRKEYDEILADCMEARPAPISFKITMEGANGKKS